MATTKPRSRGSSTSSSSRSGSARSGGSARSRSGGRGSSKPKSTSTNAKNSSKWSASGPAKRSSPAPERPSFLSQVFDGRGNDVGGLALILVGVMAGLGTYARLGGAFGRFTDSLFAGAFGVLRFGVPVGLIAIGVGLVRGSDPEREHERIRFRAGVGLAVMCVAGFVHVVTVPLLGGEFSLGSLRRSGGLVGWISGQWLLNLVGQWGGLLVLVLLSVLAVSLITGKKLSELAAQARQGLAPLLSVFRMGTGSLFRLGPPDAQRDPTLEDTIDPEADTTVMKRPRLFDQDEDGKGAPAKPKRSGDTTNALEVPDPPRPKPFVSVPEVSTIEPEQLQIQLGAGPSEWKLPPMQMLSRSKVQEVDTREVELRGERLEAALAEHGVETRLVGMVVGPTVTRYELELGVGVKVSRVTSLNKDIAYALASPDVRIIAPIPGRQAIGVEVPNAERHVVALGDILCSEEAARASHALEVGIGRDIAGRACLVNLATMPHVLIAGQTGAGKSSCLNSIMTSIMMRATPDQVGLILIDPKRVELTQYDRIPHLLTSVVTNPKKAANALDWAVREMERRYDLLSEVGVRDITGYNTAFDKGELSTPLGDDREFQRLRYILVVVDELADLMMVAARDVENSICRLAQMARAVGIHLVIATQRPSVNVITGVIKANVPARMAFAVASATDSKVILDQGGAERLVGRGDMLVLGPAASTPSRIQGAWVEEAEIHSIAAFWREQTPEPEALYEDGVADEPTGPTPGVGGAEVEDDEDDMLKQAWELVVRSQLGSTSMLQRKLRVGFARAGRLMDLLENRGIVGPSEGSKARTVLMTPEELEDLIESGQF